MLDRPLDPDLDPGTVAAIAAIRHRRHRYQRRFLRIVLSTVVSVALGLGLGVFSSGGSTEHGTTGVDTPLPPRARTDTPGLGDSPQNQVDQLQQLTRDLQSGR